ncbi:DUF1972 domain-containing protein [Enterococcus gilvus]|uniref:beta 1-4 rhamnosyltransferase Cps2T n=1 Tax=Enterococcus gilvus TaxID=160453 RepID=UPI003D6AE9E8
MGDGKQHIYIIGSKGIPAKYGGFETFVEKLTEYQVNKNIQYHVACMTENSAKSGITDEHFEHNGAKCFNIDVPNIGPAKAIYYDIAALKFAIQFAKNNQHQQPIFYVLACRIGPFIKNLKKQINDLEGKLFVNPDGHEWLRRKWSYPVRCYWKYSERLMVKYADLLICDSKNIEKYILDNYQEYSPKTIYISYGTELERSELSNNSIEVSQWYKEKDILIDNYYLVVGRFVPENNYEIMIREFMKSDERRDFVLITNIEENKFYKRLKQKTHFDKDPRIKFVGTVYDPELLKFIRENAFAYLHGHEVGGTNPSLLEAMASTKINLLLDVEFNKEVGADSVLYWSKEYGDLCNLINRLKSNNVNLLTEYPIERINNFFRWEKINDAYENMFKTV